MRVRLGRLIAALVLAILGFLLARGTLPVLANGGHPMSDWQRFETGSRAIVFEDAADRAYEADTWTGGDASSGYRVEARSVDGAPLFVGIARADQLVGLEPRGPSFAPCPRRVPRGYLEGVSHEVVNGSHSRNAGTRQPPPPESVRIWDTKAMGTTAAVSWTIGAMEGGLEPCRTLSWYPVVMNADGSPGVRADVKFGAKILPLAVVGAGIAVALVLASAFLGATALRRSRASSA